MQFFHGPLTAVLCLSLVCPQARVADSGPGAADHDAKRADRRAADSAKSLEGDARILHALNRFSFGPRPGDVDAVRAKGLDKWFDEQLHPANLDETNLNARLSQFPAMQWRVDELLYRVPSNAIIRQTLDGKLPVPERG